MLPAEAVATLRGGGSRVRSAPVASWGGDTNRRGDRPGGARRRYRTVCGAGTSLPGSLCPVCGPHARFGGRGGGRGAGSVHSCVRAAAAVPRPRQLRRVVLSDPAEPVPGGAAAGGPGGSRGGCRDRTGDGAGGRPVGAGRAAPRAATSAVGADAGAARGVRAEARGRL